MKFSIKKDISIGKWFKEQYIKWKFDIQWDSFQEMFEGDIAIENMDWNVWIIVWPSWTGKSTIAKELFWDNFIKLEYGNNAIIEELGVYGDINKITNIFNKVWLNGHKRWVKAYHLLSNWEKMRVDLANTLLQNKEISIFDEFTSVVDRQVAKVASYAIAKTIRKQKKQFIAIWCHYDILERLEPDRIFDTRNMSFKVGKMSPNTKDLQSNWISESEGMKSEIYLRNIII